MALDGGEAVVEREAFRRVDEAFCQGDYAEAFRTAREWADRECDWAENCLGGLYFCGLGVDTDPAKAFYFYYRAAKHGNGGLGGVLGYFLRRERRDSRQIPVLRQLAMSGPGS